MSRRVRLSLPFVSVLMALLLAPAIGRAATTDAEVQRGLRGLVQAEGGPPGAIATLYRDGKLTTLSAGRSNIERRGAPTATQHMRIASIAKAFSGAVALHLVQEGRLGLDDTIGQRRPDLPTAWAAVTVRQMLNHTSGLPDYTRSDAFAKQAMDDPQGYVAPTEIIDWVRKSPLEFTPGSKYEYSNTDNIVVGLIAETVCGTPYPALLKDIVFGPANLTQTSFPTHRISLPAPYIHGYLVNPERRPQRRDALPQPERGVGVGRRRLDAHRPLGVHPRRPRPEVLRRSPAGRADEVRPRVLEPRRARARTPPASRSSATRRAAASSTATPGTSPATCSGPPSTADGTRSVTTSLNIPAPKGALLRQLRDLQGKAVCALLGK